MSVLGTITGAGMVAYADGPPIEADYEITVLQRGGFKEGRGQIRANSGALLEMMQARQVILTTERNGKIEIVVKRFASGSEWADIVVSGAIPGY